MRLLLMRMLRTERGATLVVVALGLLVLMSMSVFVIDYGIMWLGRREAQNAADAGALAGALARAYDEMADPPSAGGKVEQAAVKTAQLNQVWQEAPAVPPPTYACPAGIGTGECVTVNVYRNGEFGSNPLPTWFGPLLNINSQGVRATATAWAYDSDSVRCLKPWAIPDKWIDNNDVDPPIDKTFTQEDRFEKYLKQGVPLPTPDVYRPPSDGSPTGYSIQDIGTKVSLKDGNDENGPVTASFYYAIDLPGSSGASDYRWNIANCYPNTIKWGDPANPVYLNPKNGNVKGPTKQGVADLIAMDQSATWNGATKSWQGGCCYGGNTSCCVNGMSPRVVPVAAFDVDAFEEGRQSGNNLTIKVVNVIGFFVLPMKSNDVEGHIMLYPGESSPNTDIDSDSAFTKAVSLVR